METRLALARLLRQLRQTSQLTQKAVAERIGSDQASVSKAENGDAAVSVEWLLRAAFALGACRKQVGETLCG